MALERVQLAHAAESSRIEAETESLRNTLLASISYDLRTPLAVIAGAGSTLADSASPLDADSRQRLAQSIESRARDMSDLISNVLDLTRLESEGLVLRRDWETIDDLVGVALERSGERLRDHPVELSLPEELPPVHVDATLVVQLFTNLLENAAKYTPPGTRVLISAGAPVRDNAAGRGTRGMTTAMHQVLVVEDEPGIRTVVRMMLQSARYRVIEAETASRADIEARTHRPDLMLVDLGLPDGDGLDVIRRIRAWSPVPIIVLSARTMEAQKVAALDAGADDFVTKPFSSPELLARVRAALRRVTRPGTQPAKLAIGRASIDLARRSAVIDGRELHLTPLEYRVLECLARNPGMIVTQRHLLREAWGPDRTGDTRSLRVCIRNLRTKLEQEPARPRNIVTEAGLGYRLRTED